MSYKNALNMAVAGALVLGTTLSANAAEMLFFNSFDAPNGNPNLGANATYGTNEFISGTGNFNVHDRFTNPYAGGDSGCSGACNTTNGVDGDGMKWSPGMSGNVLGHTYANYNNDNVYYQIDNLSLNNRLTDLQLMFDFDSWIESDAPDGFAVAISKDAGTNWNLLNPNGLSEMQYDPGPDTIGEVGTYNSWDTGLGTLNALTGQDTSIGANIEGFDGWDSNNCWHDTGGTKRCDHTALDMAGTAMFDISDMYAGETISLRFAFASDSDGSSYQAEGINIDNVKVTGVCTSGSGSDCGGGGPMGGVPEPGSLTLALLGMAAMYRSRRAKST